ncbi:DUF397 domain-containing protein [Streptomyces tendae]|uniref:DUF397 domain-containing protein n=1 Tax=Streptomyces tendae TaxID=1932 RepID=UPI003652D6EB
MGGDRPLPRPALGRRGADPALEPHGLAAPRPRPVRAAGGSRPTPPPGPRPRPRPSTAATAACSKAIPTTIQWHKSSYNGDQGGECVECAPLGRLAWRKSSYSGDQGGNCVEVGELTAIVAVRDSKSSAGPILTLAPATFTAFVGWAATAGRAPAQVNVSVRFIVFARVPAVHPDDAERKPRPWPLPN